MLANRENIPDTQDIRATLNSTFSLIDIIIYINKKHYKQSQDERLSSEEKLRRTDNVWLWGAVGEGVEEGMLVLRHLYARAYIPSPTLSPTAAYCCAWGWVSLNFVGDFSFLSSGLWLWIIIAYNHVLKITFACMRDLFSSSKNRKKNVNSRAMLDLFHILILY